jgi:hypothetical protein
MPICYAEWGLAYWSVCMETKISCFAVMPQCLCYHYFKTYNSFIIIDWHNSFHLGSSSLFVWFVWLFLNSSSTATSGRVVWDVIWWLWIMVERYMEGSSYIIIQVLTLTFFWWDSGKSFLILCSRVAGTSLLHRVSTNYF